MKKRILFIIGVLDSGGVSKSMLSLLNVIDKDNYDVSLLTISGRGTFQNAIPNGVHVITDWRLEALMNRGKGVVTLIQKGCLALALGSCIRLLLSTVNKAWAGWWLSRLMPCVSKEEFDLIVDYNGQTQLYYMVDKLNAKKKITFFHSDYRKWRYYESMDRKYFAKVDGVYTISDICVEALREVFPKYSHKVRLMENIVSPTLIRNMAVQPIEPKKTYKFLLVSLGHVLRTKGSDMALEVAAELQKRGVDFEWWFVGKVGNDCDYVQMAKDLGVSERIHFLGVQPNPYPYVNAADILVHLAQFEGKSIALDEAKLLCKPVVVTNFSTVNDQFEDKVNSSICEMNVSSATDAIIELIDDEKLRLSYSNYLATHVRDNSDEVNKIYKLLA